MRRLVIIFFLFSSLFCFSQQNKPQKIKIVSVEHDSIYINTKYLQTISESEKAAIAFVTLHDSRDCEWDGEVNKDMSNLSCRITKALGLGYQCSAMHIALLQKWLGKDSSASEEIKYCPMTPNTAHQLHGIGKVLLTKLTPNKFKIDYSADGVNIRMMSYWSFDATIIFQIDNDILKIVSRKEYNVDKGKM
jgi:hypothetical protein